MEFSPQLAKIRKELFYGSSDYTKNQPDLIIPSHFKMVAPSQVDSFVELLKDNIKEEPEILLYFHFPFCFSECLFCNSFPLKADKLVQQDYLQHLLKEVELFSKQGVFDGKKVKCIYFGGGTPTSFPNSDIKQVIDKITSCVELSDNCSISTEAHPLTLGSEKRIEELLTAGFNRMSIGCQSFDSDVLQHCNRSNTESQIYQIVKSAQKSGLAINIDMMTGLPGQTIASVKNDLRILSEIRPDAVEYIRHEIVNPLIVDLYTSRPDLIVHDDTLFEMVFITQEWMQQNGYEQNGRFSNDRQWGYRFHWLQEMPIIAFGSRTRSYTKTICYDKHEDLPMYIRMIDKQIPPVARVIHLTKQERMFRSLILGLQLKRGLDTAHFQKTYGESAQKVFFALLAKLEEYGCVNNNADYISLTQYGAYFVEDVCDYIIDTALKDEPGDVVRAPHSGGGRYSVLAQ